MIWYQNPMLTTRLQMELKKINQRIVQLATTYGKTTEEFKAEANPGMSKSKINALASKYGRNTSVFKQATAILSKGPARPFVSESASGNEKIDIRAINKLIRSGKANRSELNQILAQVAGLRITENGELEKVPGGIETVKEMRTKTRKRLPTMGEDPDEYSDSEIDSITEQLAEFSENFQTTYELGMARLGQRALREDPVTKMLWGENRSRRLTYREMEEIMKRIRSMIGDARRDALTIEKDKGGNI